MSVRRRDLTRDLPRMRAPAAAAATPAVISRTARCFGPTNTSFDQGQNSIRVPEGEDRAWYVVVAPDAEERRMLADRLGLHELAISDALRERHPAKLEDYGDHLFVIAHTPVEDEHLPTRKIAICKCL